MIKAAHWDSNGLQTPNSWLNMAIQNDCGPIHTIPEEYSNGGCNLKRHHVFRPHYAGGIWKRTNHRGFWICVWEKLGREITWLWCCRCFQKLRLFFVHKKTQSQRFQTTPVLKERFRKAPFLWEISVDGRPNRRNKSAFSNFSSEMRTVPQKQAAVDNNPAGIRWINSDLIRIQDKDNVVILVA